MLALRTSSASSDELSFRACHFESTAKTRHPVAAAIHSHHVDD
jgi:hypothetical protein